MSQRTRRVGDRGQVTIPKWLREKYDISGGDAVVIDEGDGKITLKKRTTDEELERAYRENAERAEQVSEEWSGASVEADRYLGDAPVVEGNGLSWDPDRGLRQLSDDSDE